MTFAQLLLFIAVAFNLQSVGALVQLRRQTPSSFARRIRWSLLLIVLVNPCLVGTSATRRWYDTVYWTQLHQQGLVPATPPLLPAWLSTLIALYLIGAFIYALSQVILFARSQGVLRTQV